MADICVCYILPQLSKLTRTSEENSFDGVAYGVDGLFNSTEYFKLSTKIASYQGTNQNLSDIKQARVSLVHFYKNNFAPTVDNTTIVLYISSGHCYLI